MPDSLYFSKLNTYLFGEVPVIGFTNGISDPIVASSLSQLGNISV
jgi:hypothetical protein